MYEFATHNSEFYKLFNEYVEGVERLYQIHLDEGIYQNHLSEDQSFPFPERMQIVYMLAKSTKDFNYLWQTACSSITNELIERFGLIPIEN